VPRWLKIALQLLVSGGIVVFLLWRIDLGQTVELVGESDFALLLLSLVIFVATTWLMAWRWALLLAAKGIHEPFRWLLRMYFVGYAAAQVLPTAVGGDAVRIVEHSRRRPDARADTAAAVVMERVLGSAGTLVLVALGLAVAAGRYEGIRLLVILEAVFLLGMAVLGVLLFSRRTRRVLEQHVFPLGRRLRLDQPLTSFHRAMHEYRSAPRALLAVLAVTVLTQSSRIVSIWLCGEAVGLDVSPLVYVILGPLLFLVQMVPFTVNGLGVREAFFVVFLGRFGVDADAAFATGFLYYAVTIVTSLPGAFLLFWRGRRPAPTPLPGAHRPKLDR
jgi:glycosyltransferase 2 family protein